MIARQRISGAIAHPVVLVARLSDSVGLVQEVKKLAARQRPCRDYMRIFPKAGHATGASEALAAKISKHLRSGQANHAQLGKWRRLKQVTAAFANPRCHVAGETLLACIHLQDEQVTIASKSRMHLEQRPLGRRVGSTEIGPKWTPTTARNNQDSLHSKSRSQVAGLMSLIQPQTDWERKTPLRLPIVR